MTRGVALSHVGTEKHITYLGLALSAGAKSHDVPFQNTILLRLDLYYALKGWG